MGTKDSISANHSKKDGYARYIFGQRLAPYFFVLPYFFIFLCFSLFPIIFSVYISFQEWNGIMDPVFVGLQNYQEVLKDPRFFKALGNTFLLVIMIIPPQIFLGFMIAVILNDRRMVLKKSFRLLNFLPYLTTPIALGVIFGILFEPNFGTVNEFFNIIGLPSVQWTTQVWPARILVAMITVWRYAGYTAVLFMAGITNISADIYEASEIDGASFWERTWYITLPMLKPVMIFVMISTLIGCFQIFEEPFIIFTASNKLIGGPDNAVLTGVWLFYDTAFSNQLRNGYAAAIAMCLFIVIALASFTVNKIMNGREEKR